jgi:hypothetical protein
LVFGDDSRGTGAGFLRISMIAAVIGVYAIQQSLSIFVRVFVQSLCGFSAPTIRQFGV